MKVRQEKSQKYLKNKVTTGFKALKDKEKKIQEEEKKLFNKKIVSADEYKKVNGFETKS